MVESLELDDFSGGMKIAREPSFFKENEWADIEGFVLEDQGNLRAQWPLHKYESNTSRRFILFSASDPGYILTQPDQGGALSWRMAGSSSLSITESWTPLKNADDSTPTTEATIYYGLCTVPLPGVGTTGFTAGLLLNSLYMSDTSAAIIVYREEGGSDLRFKETTNHWPNDTNTDGIPRANLGVMWNGVLVLGDTERAADPGQAWSSSNTKRVRNGMYFSEPGQPFRWNKDSFVQVATADAIITGMHVIDAGLVVITYSKSGGGVYLLRGTPADFVLETVREGLGSWIVPDYDSNARNLSTLWSHQGTVCWVGFGGGVWQTDGDRVARLDADLGIDLFGSIRVVDFGPYLIAGPYVLRQVDEEGRAAWTRLKLPPGTFYEPIGAIGDRFYFRIERGSVFRLYFFDKDRATMGLPNIGRGMSAEGAMDISVATRTLAGGDGHQKTFWRSVGVLAEPGLLGWYGPQPQVPTIEKIVMYPGPAGWVDDTDPKVERTVDLPLSDYPDRIRRDVQVKGIGASREFAARIHFKGDVVLEQVTIFYEPSTASKSPEGL